ncbi:MAG: DMT family transporter [Eubacteriales bacterium]|nr:DMT family transporter [Eubacteriales bacterium]
MKISKKGRGIIHILAAAFCFALMSFFVRLAGDVPSMQKCFFRNIVAVVVALIILLRSEDKFKMQKGSLPFLLIRSFCGCAGLICNFYAIDQINLSDANMLNKLSPFFAIIFSYFILREKANRVEWTAVIIAFVGALFVMKPSFHVEFLPALIGALGGLGAGVAYTFVRLLGGRGERGPMIVFFFSAFSTMVTAPFMLLDYHPMALWQWITLIMAGIAAMGGQLNITAAYTYAPAKEISVFDYSQIIFAALLGFFFLGQVPDLLSVVGYVFIIGAAIGRWWYR